MDYIVELASDNKTNMQADLDRTGIFPASFESARNLLTDFVEANDGNFKGWFNHKGELMVGSAHVEMTEQAAEQLQDLNVSLLRNPNSEPFVARIEGESFDIHPKNKIKIFPVKVKGAECTI